MAPHANLKPEGSELPPLAVVGMAMRLPEDASTAEAFWDMLMSRRCAAKGYPKDRLNISAWYHPDVDRLDAMPMREAHFINDDLSVFDAPFFSINSNEATGMDPMQRFLLETVYHAVEDAGMSTEHISNTKTCVFTGCCNADYGNFLDLDPVMPAQYHMLGNAMNFFANRISWFFNLLGPSANLDTACSSSLLALDLACQSIWNGDSTMGIACGGNLLLSIGTGQHMSNIGALSKDSRCFSFDHRANGYSRGEGFAVLVIKPLEQAVKDNDTIRAVIRSSASNQDGKTSTITQPSRKSQEALIRHAYTKASLDMGATRYFEAHGTGTPVGDPIEASAIGSAFRSFRSPSDPLYIGSVKSNIGHLEGASGLPGVIKAVLALEKGVIPPMSINFEKLNPKIDAEFLNLRVPAEAVPWPSTGLRRASISSFGFGGANSHVVLDDAYNCLLEYGLTGNHNTVPEPPSPQNLKGLLGVTNSEITGTSINGDSAVQEAKLLVWSAADEDGVKRIKNVWGKYFTTSPLSQEADETYLQNLAHTLSSRRSHLPWRSFAVGTNANLAAIADQISGPLKATKSPNLAFVFTGQGAQWYAMGRELLAQYPIFKKSIVDAATFFGHLGCSWNALDELLREENESQINKPEFSQALCTALQVALVDLLESFGVYPTTVVGHSSGEIAAAYASKALSRESAWRVAYHRGRLNAQLVQNATMKGGMMAVGLTKEDAKPYLDAVTSELGASRLVIACENSPTSLTISGESNHLDHLQSTLGKDKVFCRRLKVEVAYHSFQMQEISDEYLACINNLSSDDRPRDNLPTIVSSVTGTWAANEEFLKPAYWVKNLLQPVLFSSAIATLASASSKGMKKKLDGSHRRFKTIDQFVEIGPHSALQGPIRETLRSMDQSLSGYTTLLKRKVSAVQSTLEAAGHLYCVGYPIHLGRVNANGEASASKLPLKSLVGLPQYPFNKTHKYWFESRLSKDNRFRKFPRLDLLGTRSNDWNTLEPRWRQIIRLAELPWVRDHKINGTILYPGAGMLIMALEAVKQLADPARELLGFSFNDVNFRTALSIPADSQGVEVDTHLRLRDDQDDEKSPWFEFRLLRHQDDDTWVENCNGSVKLVYATEHSEIDQGNESRLWKERHLLHYQELSQKCSIQLDTEAFYEHATKFGYEYGPTFRPITSLAYDGSTNVVTEIDTFPWSMYESKEAPQPYTIHPTVLDAMLQLVACIRSKGATETMMTEIPVQLSRVWVSNKGLNHRDSKRIKGYMVQESHGVHGSKYGMAVLDQEEREVLIDIEGYATNTVSGSAGDDLEQASEARCHKIEWKPDVDLLLIDDILSLPPSDDLAENELAGFGTNLEFLVMAFIQRALRQIEGDQNHQLKSDRTTKTYHDWMLRKLESLQDSTSQFSTEEWKSRLLDEDYVSQLAETISKTNKRGHIFTTVGKNLGKILTGQIEIHSVLSGGAEHVADQLSEDSLKTLPCVKRVGNYLDLYAHKYPAAKFLEVGAGGGGMTHHVIRAIAASEEGEQGKPRCASFDFTDVSIDVLERAKEEFRSYGKLMSFKTLDIQLDPASQEFECGTYDVVVVSQVLYGTNLKVALGNCRKLLKPGGKLILFDRTEAEKYPEAFVFGLFEDSWPSSEEPLARKTYTEEKEWNDLLKQSGFSGNEPVLADHNNAGDHEYSVMISTAVSEDKIKQESRNVLLVHSPEQEQLAGVIQQTLVSSEAWDIQTTTLGKATESLRSDSLVIFLLELSEPFWENPDQNDFQNTQKLILQASKVLWVGRGGGFDSPSPSFRLVEGLFRVLHSEIANSVYTYVSLESEGTLNNRQLHHLAKVCQSLFISQNPEREHIEHNGVLHINRVVDSRTLNQSVHERQLPKQRKQAKIGCDQALEVAVGTPGLLNTLHFTEDTTQSAELQPNEVEVQVQCIGLNFRDVLIAMGRRGLSGMGSCCTGIVSRVGSECNDLKVGMRVGVVALKIFRTFVRASIENICQLPDSLGFAAGASVDVTHITAWHSLVEIARLEAGETILIHSGSGGTGQAAIQVAQHLGAKIFATVGSVKKKELLMSRYNIPADHIFSSRDTVFAQSIKRLTNGQGVDVVFNSLSGEKLAKSWECIAPYGRFIEIGKKDVLGQSKLNMLYFARNVTFSCIDIASMVIERPKLCMKALRAIYPLVIEGVLAPPHPLQVYGVSEMEQAFRVMQGGQSSGKIVIEFRPDDHVEMLLDTKPTSSFEPTATYVIAGGLGGLGRSVTKWFVERGARNLILLSRSGAQSSDTQAFVGDLTAQGVCVRAPACDIADMTSLQATLSECSSDMPPIKGCIQATMVLKDSTFEGLSWESWNAVLRPKVQGSWNLHHALPSGMAFFIMFASVSGIVGLRGQSNYAAANTFLDSLAKYRLSLGENATSLDLGMFKSLGIMHTEKGLGNKVDPRDEWDPVTESELLALLDYYCNAPDKGWTPTQSQPMIGANVTAKLREHDTAYWLEKPSFSHLAVYDSTIGPGETSAGRANFRTIFATVSSLEDATAAVTETFIHRIATMLSLTAKDLDKSRPLNSYGVDSLVAVEIRSWFSKELRADVAIFDILGSGTIADVARMAAARSEYRKGKWMTD